MNPPGVSGCPLPQLTWARGASPRTGGSLRNRYTLWSARWRPFWTVREARLRVWGPGGAGKAGVARKGLAVVAEAPAEPSYWGLVRDYLVAGGPGECGVGWRGRARGGPGALRVGALQRRENQHSVGYFAFQSDFHLLTWPCWTLSAVLWDVQVIIIIPRVWDCWRCWWRASWLG